MCWHETYLPLSYVDMRYKYVDMQLIYINNMHMHILLFFLSNMSTYEMTCNIIMSTCNIHLTMLTCKIFLIDQKLFKISKIIKLHKHVTSNMLNDTCSCLCWHAAYLWWYGLIYVDIYRVYVNMQLINVDMRNKYVNMQFILFFDMQQHVYVYLVNIKKICMST